VNIRGSAPLLLCGFVMFLACRAPAAISVTPGGTGWLTFNEAPGSTNWSTLLIPGSDTVISNHASMDFIVQQYAAANINAPLTITATYPPATSSTFGARWNSQARALQTRPAGANTAVLLMATLRNDTGTSLSGVGFSFGMVRAANTMSEELPGYHVYFSHSGGTNTWQPVLPPGGVFTNGDLSVALDVGSWAPGTLLYILFADDNGSLTDDGYLIDNFALGPVPIPVLTPRLAIERLPFASSASTSIELSWPVPATAYHVQYKTNLNDTNWFLGPQFAETSNDVHRVQPPLMSPQTFYRLIKF
jgi:hypothetical protein